MPWALSETGPKVSMATMTPTVVSSPQPARAESPAAAVRHLLDGLVIAASVWFVGWVLVSEPTDVLGAATLYGCLPLLLPAAVAAVAGGLTSVLTMRAHRPRHITVRVAAGVTVNAFSTSTALPARRSARAIARCCGCGVAM